MRLIDADKIGLTDFEIVMCNGDYKKALTVLLDKITNQPTAYSVDEVVEQLSKLPQYKLDLADAMIDTLENRRYRHFVCLEDVTEIVKQGGVSDDVCEWRYNDTEYCLESSCNHLQIFMDDCPKQNEYSFCPYCGKKIKVVE